MFFEMTKQEWEEIRMALIQSGKIRETGDAAGQLIDFPATVVVLRARVGSAN